MPSLNERKNKLKEKKDAEPGDLFISFFFNLKHFQPTLPKIFSTWYVLRSWTYTYAAAPIFYTLVILTNQILFVLYKYEKRKKESKRAKRLHFFSEQILQAGFSFQPFVRDLKCFRIYCLSGKYSPTWIVWETKHEQRIKVCYNNYANYEKTIITKINSRNKNMRIHFCLHSITPHIHDVHVCLKCK